MRWTRFLHSTAGGLSTAIEIELRGIPAHAWDLSTADLLLDEFCWIEGIHPSTAERRDVFLLKAWRLNPHHIPLEMVLKIVEPHLAGCPHSGVRTLTYPISVRVAPFVQPSSTGDDSSPPPPPADEHRRRCRSRNRRQHLAATISVFTSGGGGRLLDIHHGRRASVHDHLGPRDTGRHPRCPLPQATACPTCPPLMLRRWCC